MSPNKIRMIDVTTKKVTRRTATARARINTSHKTIGLIKNNKIPKGDVLLVAQTAGILAAKRTPELIPLCHPLLLTNIIIDFAISSQSNFIDITATVTGKGNTGFEMEAFMAASIAALTIYDMCKMLDKSMTITNIYLVKKTGGKSGTYSVE